MEQQVAGPKPRVYAMVGQTPDIRQLHNQPAHWAWMAALLRSADVRKRVMSDDLADLTPARLAEFDVVVNYSADGHPTPEQMGALISAIEGGLGFVGIHAVTAAFKTNEPFHQMIGSWFVTHPPIQPFTVTITDHDHPVTQGIPDFDIDDERYEIRTIVDDIKVLAETDGHPQVYVRQQGQGRICYIAPGHDQRSLQHPHFIQLVHQAITWAARQQ